MLRISRYYWFAIAVIIFGLCLFLAIHIFVPGTPGETTNGKSTHLGSTPSIVGTPTQATSTPHPTATPTPPDILSPVQLSSDPYTNSTSQHRTEVEPASYSYGSTIVTAFQAGRFVDVGS